MFFRTVITFYATVNGFDSRAIVGVVWPFLCCYTVTGGKTLGLHMDSHDLNVISHLGQALWADDTHAEKASLDAITAVTSLGLTSERSVEKVSEALLQRAAREGVQPNAGALNRPFFRISPEERFLLSALHVGRWSYVRLARVLRKKTDEVARMAWAARLHIVSAPGKAPCVPYPTGSDLRGPKCPEYDPLAPWTQKFLDEETTSAERIFLQNHIMSCDRCRQALSRSRNVYYLADAMVPRPAESESNERIRRLENIAARMAVAYIPRRQGFARSVAVFVSRRDVQWLIAAIFVFFAVLSLK